MCESFTHFFGKSAVHSSRRRFAIINTTNTTILYYYTILCHYTILLYKYYFTFLFSLLLYFADDSFVCLYNHFFFFILSPSSLSCPLFENSFIYYVVSLLGYSSLSSQSLLIISVQMSLSMNSSLTTFLSISIVVVIIDHYSTPPNGRLVNQWTVTITLIRIGILRINSIIDLWWPLQHVNFEIASYLC